MLIIVLIIIVIFLLFLSPKKQFGGDDRQLTYAIYPPLEFEDTGCEPGKMITKEKYAFNCFSFDMSYEFINDKAKNPNNAIKLKKGNFDARYGDGTDIREFANVLRKYGFRKNYSADYVNFSYNAPFFGNGLPHVRDTHPIFRNLKSSLKNKLADTRELDRRDIFANHTKYVPWAQKIPANFDREKLFNDLATKLEFGGNIYIVKLENTMKQSGIYLAENLQNLTEILQKPDVAAKGGIISQYIKNPLLAKDGRKVTFRKMILAQYYHGILKFYVFRDYVRVFTSMAPYKQSDWLNRDIHITGNIAPDQQPRIIFPGDFDLNAEQAEKIQNNINIAALECANLIKDKINIYHDGNEYVAYQAIGVDVLIENNPEFSPWILEMNRIPGFHRYGPLEGWNEYNKAFSAKYYNWVFNTVIGPVFGVGDRIAPDMMAKSDSSGELRQYFDELKNLYAIKTGELAWQIYDYDKNIGLLEYNETKGKIIHMDPRIKSEYPNIEKYCSALLKAYGKK